ncbi:MAG: DNA adenine methylase [Chlorobi bacterium]|nr:DNA adenine methylase [Chlorobiota bacterium]
MIVTRQGNLFPDMHDVVANLKPVNVASIPQRSPFRYPGGKTWFVPVFRNWLAQKLFKPAILVEPFAGGGIISLTALFEHLVQRAVMVEIDEDIAAVWQAIVDGQASWLARRILEFDLTRETLLEELSKEELEIREKAFHTILRNRTSHGGILAGGSGLLKHGENGKGICSRWYPQTLARRFSGIDEVSEKIDFRQEDGLQVMQAYADRSDVVFFIDPPYTAGGKKAGKRLYRYSEIDHERLFEICQSVAGDFLMTYDNAEEVKQIARHHSFQMRLVPMTNTHNATMEELVIGKDLSWMDSSPAVHEPDVVYGG